MGPHKLLNPEALVFLLIGASAVGKSSLAFNLHESGVVETQPTWTTREPRPEETTKGYDHYFVDDARFDAEKLRGGFLAQEKLYGSRYGVPFLHEPSNGQEVLMVLKPLFIPKFKTFYPNTRVIQIDASAEVLPGRMRARGQTEEEIIVRMQEYEPETRAGRDFADVILNNDGPFEETYRQLEAQIHLDRESYQSRQAA